MGRLLDPSVLALVFDPSLELEALPLALALSIAVPVPAPVSKAYVSYPVSVPVEVPNPTLTSTPWSSAARLVTSINAELDYLRDKRMVEAMRILNCICRIISNYE